MVVPKVIGAGLSTNGRWWASYTRTIWIAEIKVLHETIFERLMPTFSQIGQEASEVSRLELEGLGRWAGSDSDPASAAEAAQDAGINYYTMRTDAQQALLNLFAVALHHLFEQQALTLLRKELLPRSHEDDTSLMNSRTFVTSLKHQGIIVADYPEWSTLEELRLAANVAKHAEGDSAKSLRKLNPSLFTPSILKDQPDSPLYGSIGTVLAPMFGRDLYITEIDLERYFRAATGFWERLADELEAQ